MTSNLDTSVPKTKMYLLPKWAHCPIISGSATSFCVHSQVCFNAQRFLTSHHWPALRRTEPLCYVVSTVQFCIAVVRSCTTRCDGAHSSKSRPRKRLHLDSCSNASWANKERKVTPVWPIKKKSYASSWSPQIKKSITPVLQHCSVFSCQHTLFTMVIAMTTVRL